jgi:hypothetical protein
MHTQNAQSGLLPLWQAPFGQVAMSVKKTNPNDSDKSVADTVALMGIHARNASSSSQVKAALQEAGVNQQGLTEDQIINRIFSFIKGKIDFVQDEDQLGGMFYNPDSKELLITPPVLLSMSHPRGDCDDFSMLGCSMLMAKGVKCDFVTVAANSSFPSEFSHIYCMVRTRDGRVIPFDASHGKEAGWETARAYRKQVWPVFNWTGESMGRGGMGMVIDGSRAAFDTRFRKGLMGLIMSNGLGQVSCSTDDQGNMTCSTDVVQNPVNPVDVTLAQSTIMTGPNVTPGQLASMNSNPVSISSPPSSSGGVNWNSILQTITGAASKIAVQTSQPAGIQTQTCNAQGVCTTSSEVLPAGYAGTLPSLGLNSASLSGLLPLLLIGAVVIFAMDQH